MLTDYALILHEAIKDLNQLDDVVMTDIDQGCYVQAANNLGRVRELGRKLATISDLIARELAHRSTSSHQARGGNKP